MIVFIVLIVSILIWFYLCARFDTILKKRHPMIYEEIGKPNLLTNNTFSNNILFFKFLFSNEWKKLNDQKLIKLAQFMKLFFIGYICFLLYIFTIEIHTNAS